MWRGVFYGGAAVGLLAGIWWFQSNHRPNTSESVLETTRPPEPAPLCPWREPEADLRKFFADATRHETETRILSGRRVELAGSLGRPPAPDELALHVHRIFREAHPLGTVMTRRVKGEFGSIEIVLATDPGGQVRGVRFQRVREPPSITAALQKPEWLAAFAGKTAASHWRLGDDLPAVEAEAIPSAQAVVEGVRSLLILLSAAENSPLSQRTGEGESLAPPAHH